MKEYNWRKEREKFQPDFNKRPQEEAPVQQAVIPPPPPSRSWKKILAVIFIAVVVIGVVVRTVQSCRQPEDSSIGLANAAEKHKGAVALVACKIELVNGKKIVDGVGTAWAIAPDKFVTNAHVAIGIRQYAEKAVEKLAEYLVAQEIKKSGAKSPEEFVKKVGKEQAQALLEKTTALVRTQIKQVSGEVLINGCTRKSYPITHYQIHRDYGIAKSNFDPDLAVLTVSGENSVFFELAPEKELYALKSGEPIAFLGFPMENLENGNVNLEMPIASMQSGIIVAVSDFDMKDAGSKGNVLLRHNLPLTGGASGSPVFRRDGKVIGILYAMNTTNQITKTSEGLSVKRAPSGAMINFAVRIDLLKGMGEPASSAEFLKLQ